jgi:YD repeat-containing protein
VLHAFSYNAGGELLSADDPDSDFARYAYDGLGRVTQVDNDGTPGVPRVVLDMTYDANGNAPHGLVQA